MKHNVCVFSTSDNTYVPNCVVALLSFKKFNPDFDLFVLGRDFCEESKRLCHKYGIKVILIDLSLDFYKSWKYPPECYYHFKGPSIFHGMGYDFSICIDGDVYCNSSFLIDWESVTHIAGVSYNSIKFFLTNIDDFDNVKNLFEIKDESSFERGHTQAGLLVYNNKILTELDYYQKAKTIFDLSIRKDLPRKGDDSLLALILGLYPEIAIHYLPKTYNYINKVNGKAYLTVLNNHVNDLTVSHMIHYKPWKIHQSYPNYTYKYFVEKWRETMINNFSQTEIKNFFPQLYRERVPPSDSIKFYWFDNGKENFGDGITKYFALRLGHLKLEKPHSPMETEETVLVGVGSVMRLSRSNAIIWGSGIRSKNQTVAPAKIVRSVRGPLTRRSLIESGCECPPIYGDPALLLSRIYNPQVTKKFKLAIVPHISQFETVKSMYADEEDKEEVSIVDLRTYDVESVVDNLLKCERVVSSSLHGIIASNSYDIPVRWIKFDKNIHGDDTKFRDHFMAIGRADENYIDALGYKKIEIQSLYDSVKHYKIHIDINRIMDSGPFHNGSISKYIRYKVDEI